MKKRKLLRISLFILMLFTISCTNKEKKDEIIKLTIENPPKTILTGEEVTFTARLTNLTDKEYILYHDRPLISLYIRGKDDETPEGRFSVLTKSILEPSGYIEQTLNVNELETGEYILRSFASFSIGEERYELICEDIPIIVEDN